MSANGWGIVTLAVYAALAGAAVWRSLRGCRSGWQLWLLHVIARFFTTFMYRHRIASDCPFPAEGGGLVLANHRSPADPLLIFSASPLKRTGYQIRRVEFLTAAEYCDLGGPLSFITRHMHVIPVARSGRDMGPVKEALRRIREGKLVGVFPEGRINTGAGLLPGSPGIAWLALHSQSPVYPVFIHNAPQGTTMVAPFLRFCRVRVTFGPPVILSQYYGRRINQELLDQVTDILMRRLARLGSVPYAGAESHEASESTNGNGAAHVASAVPG